VVFFSSFINTLKCIIELILKKEAHCKLADLFIKSSLQDGEQSKEMLAAFAEQNEDCKE